MGITTTTRQPASHADYAHLEGVAVSRRKAYYKPEATVADVAANCRVTE